MVLNYQDAHSAGNRFTVGGGVRIAHCQYSLPSKATALPPSSRGLLRRPCRSGSLGISCRDGGLHHRLKGSRKSSEPADSKEDKSS